ncbi:MAG: translational GTPase TypA [Gammaproteobacteria bacterium]|nr:translational GTPase TypA [Gammaproteobacteria bacterium]
MNRANALRNVAIVAHVDHGKTTLVDRLLFQTGTLDARKPVTERVMDSNDLERERGITILAKTTAISYRDHRVNIVDTPGHADFGGEVERILSMVDSVLLLVDAVDGPMPQTRFVTRKAFAQGLNPIVVINKVDRAGARPHKVVDLVFDLFHSLDATEAQLDFPVVFTSALNGTAGFDPDDMQPDMTPLLDTILKHVPPPAVDTDGPFQMRISSLDYSSYVGVIGIGRISRGSVKANTPITVVGVDGAKRNARVLQVLGHHGLSRVEFERGTAGDIVCVTGVDSIGISDTLCAQDRVEALPALTVDEPTVTMTFCVNTSPLAGREGKFVTSRQIRERLLREASHNVALRVMETEDPDQFRVSGRGELHLSVLIENMRREGYELAVSRPRVITRTENGRTLEPFEELTLDVEETHQGRVMEALGERRGDLRDMVVDGRGRVRLTYRIAARALMGFRPHFLSLTSGTGIMSYGSAGYDAEIQGVLGQRNNGVLISIAPGKIVAYALFNLQERGRMIVQPGEECYEGMIIGIHSRDNDLVVNPLKEKKLTNIRAAGSDENIILTPPIRFSLEQALEFINDDELVEVTPKAIRVRKRRLKENERKREARSA